MLNIESRSESAFLPQDVLILNTLADLLATALHNAFVFQKLQQQSITDGLTGIKTRRFFWEALSAEWKRASRSGRPFSVVLIDLDKFKAVNDTMGHFEGDLVLARVGRLLEQKSRQSNVVARYGGDEFIILMPETGPEQAQVLAERLRQWITTDPMLASTTSPAVLAWLASRLMASPSKTSSAWRTRACMFQSAPAGIWSRRLRSLPQAKNLPLNGSRFPPTSKAFYSVSTTGRSISKNWLQCW